MVLSEIFWRDEKYDLGPLIRRLDPGGSQQPILHLDENCTNGTIFFHLLKDFLNGLANENVHFAANKAKVKISLQKIKILEVCKILQFMNAKK